MELLKRQIHLNRVGKHITNQFLIDEDYNVPDSKHDMMRIIWGEGQIKVEETKRAESYLRVIGKLHFKVLYVTDEGEQKPAALEGKIPFEEMVYIEDAGEGHFMIKNLRTEFTVSMIHSRKLSVKAMAEMEIVPEGISDEETTVDVEGNAGLYKKKRQLNLLQMHTNKKDTYRIKEEMTIPGTKENIGTMLWSEVGSRKLDTKLGQDALILSGELLVFCFYESQDGKIDWIEQPVSYEGRVECYGVDERMYHHVNANLEDVNIDVRMDEDGEMRSLGIEGTLDLRIAVYEEESLEILEDAYSLDEVCRLERREAVFEELVMQNHSKCKITEQLSLPELKEDILQICHSSGMLQIEHTETAENGIQIEGVLHICFLYVKASDEVPFDTWQGMVPFSYLMESNETYENMRYDITNAVEQLSVNLLGSGEVEVKAVLAFHSFLRKPVHTDVITNITMEPLDMKEIEKRPGIIGYIVKEGDNLWNLAKQYSTTEEGIMEVNQLAKEELKAGDKLLIFKENMSIL